MANYIGTTRTNYIRVTDVERYKELTANLVCDTDDIHHFTHTDDDGTVRYAFGAYGVIQYAEGREIEGLEETFFPELQKILPEDEAFVITEVGHEKLCYLEGYSFIVTKDNIRTVNIDKAIFATAKEMLHNDKFETRLDY